MMNRGLSVDIYRPSYDCTNRGITSTGNSIHLFDERNRLEGWITSEDEGLGDRLLVVRYNKEYLGGYLYAVPGIVVNGQVVPKPCPSHCAGWMFGGNLVATSDSRFSEAFGMGRGGIPVHDRCE